MHNAKSDVDRNSGLGNPIVSLSDGSLSLLQPENSAGLTVVDSWHAHDFEPWIAAWDYWNSNVVYSGMCALNEQYGMPAHEHTRRGRPQDEGMGHPPGRVLTTIRQQAVRIFAATSLLRTLNLYRFDAGVTTIQSHPHIEHILAVGRCASDSLNLFGTVFETYDFDHQLQQHSSHLRLAEATCAAHRNRRRGRSMARQMASVNS